MENFELVSIRVVCMHITCCGDKAESRVLNRGQEPRDRQSNDVSVCGGGVKLELGELLVLVQELTQARVRMMTGSASMRIHSLWRFVRSVQSYSECVYCMYDGARFITQRLLNSESFEKGRSTDRRETADCENSCLQQLQEKVVSIVNIDRLRHCTVMRHAREGELWYFDGYRSIFP